MKRARFAGCRWGVLAGLGGLGALTVLTAISGCQGGGGRNAGDAAYFGSVAAPNGQVFTFNNGTEPETLDPNMMSGQPDGRIARMLFEGLTVSNPQTLAPEPGRLYGIGAPYSSQGVTRGIPKASACETHVQCPTRSLPR